VILNFDLLTPKVDAFLVLKCINVESLVNPTDCVMAKLELCNSEKDLCASAKCTIQDIVLTMFRTNRQTHEQPENIMPPATLCLAKA